MRYRRHLYVMLSCAIFMPGMAYGQGSEFRVNIYAEPDTLRIGDPFTVSLRITGGEDYQYSLPDLRQTLVPLELGEPKHTRSRAGRHRFTAIEYEAFSFDTGRIALPSQAVIYWSINDTTLRRTAHTDSIWIYVASSLTADAQEIRDIKDPFPVSEPFGYWGWLLIALIAVGLFAAAYYFSRKKSGKPVALFRKPEKIRPAHEIALEALEKLNMDNLLEKGKVGEYYVRLSRILREYVENRYFIKALEMTTTELLELIESKQIGDEVAGAVKRVLVESDLVKFAQYIPPHKKSEKAFENTYGFVETTKIAPLPAEEQSA